MNRRELIRKTIKLKLLKNKIEFFEKYFVNIFVIAIFIFIFCIYNIFTNTDIKFYTIQDIQKFNINIDALKNIKIKANNKNIEFEKLLATYAKDNNYFAKNAYIEDYKNIGENKFIENIKFGIYNLNKENQQVYKMIKTINSEVQSLPIEKADISNILAINSFDINRNNFGTLFLEKDNNFNNINIVSVTNGIVENARYNGDNGLEVIVKTDSGTKYIYANLKSTNVKTGDVINVGEQIGVMGNTRQFSDEVVFERAKLSFYILYNEEYFINPYPFLSMS